MSIPLVIALFLFTKMDAPYLWYVIMIFAAAFEKYELEREYKKRTYDLLNDIKILHENYRGKLDVKLYQIEQKMDEHMNILWNKINEHPWRPSD